MNTTPPHATAGGTSEDAAHRNPSAVVEPASEPVHPDADRFFQKLPWSRNIPIFGEACQAYGPRCTLSLAACYLLCKGIANQLINYARYPMFRGRFGINAQRYQRLANISMMGWSIKAFTAMLCDAFAFMGYTKRWYQMFLCFLGAAFALGYGLLPAKQSSADIAAGFVFMTSFSKASVDILSQGHYSRLMRRTPKAGPAMVSWIWIFIMTGGIIASGIQGPLSDANLMHVGVFISAALQFLTGFIFVFNWYGERRNRVERAADARYIHEESLQEQKRPAAMPDAVPQKDLHPEEHSVEDPQAVLSNVLSDDMQVAPINDLDYEIPEPIPCCCGLFEFNKDVAVRNWRIFVYSAVMTCSVITMTCGNILADKLGLLIICICVSVVSCGTSLWALPPVIAKANVFGYLQMVVYLQLPGALESFYLATPDCNPGGPNFSYTFYSTVGAFIGNIAGMIGVVCFNYIFSKRSYRLTFVITTVIQIIASVFDIIMVNGWNIAIGIPYHAMYICGDAIFFQVCYMLAWMPSTILISRLCPRGSESLVYALMAGFSNLGQSTSSAIGAILMEYVWPVNTDVIPCDFSNVKWLLLVGHMLLPLLIIPLSILLIPAARICDDIDVDGNVIQKAVRSQQMQAETDSTPDKK